MKFRLSNNYYSNKSNGYQPSIFIIFSDKKYIDIIVANIGAAKILTTVAKGRFLRAINMDTIAIGLAMHLAWFRSSVL